MPKRKNSKVQISFVKVDSKARAARQTVKRAQSVHAAPKLEERSLESLWHDRYPEGFTFLDWHRAWNDGYPDEMAVDLYNELHPDENEQIVLEDEEDDDG